MIMRSKRAFTLVEVVTAIGILVMVVGFAGIIFKDSIESYRIAGANAEIMQNLQTITTRLDRDFSQVCRNGLLVIRFEEKTGRNETTKSTNTTPTPVRMDRIYYITTGDFQSWFDAGTRHNAARVFWGHNRDSLNNADWRNLKFTPLDKCRLAMDCLLLTPEPETTPVPDDCNKVSLVEFVSDQKGDRAVLDNSVPAKFVVSTAVDPNVRQILCENVGEFKIEWIDEAVSLYEGDYTLNWLSGSKAWGPADEWPNAIKFTFTLYDSKEILKGGRRFTHIVYLGD
jgi:type II secretory pathway pseudopilin PulG